MSIIENLSYYDIGKVTRKYLNKKVDITVCRDWLNEVISEPIVQNFIDDDTAMKMFETFRNNLNEKIETLIFENTGETKFPIGSQVKAKFSFGENFQEGDISTIMLVTRFEENTFGQGWYLYHLDNGCAVYSSEVEVV